METKFLTARDVIQRLELIYYTANSNAFCSVTADSEKRLAEIIAVYNSTGHDIWPALAEFECLDNDHRHYANPVAALNGYAEYVLRKCNYFKPARSRMVKKLKTEVKEPVQDSKRRVSSNLILSTVTEWA